MTQIKNPPEKPGRFNPMLNDFPTRTGRSFWRLPHVRMTLLAAFIGWLYSLAPADAFDFGAWNAILEKRTRVTVWEGVAYTGFDYAGLAESDEFTRLIDDLDAYPLRSLHGRDETIAFWINVYNIFAVNVVSRHFPIRGIKDAGGLLSPVWTMPAGKVDGTTYTLDGIEEGILRPLNEPGIHFAIVCASVSCPDLRAQAYTPQTLKEQLASQTRTFLQNRDKGMRIDDTAKVIHLSMLFDWYERDFAPQGGVRAFINAHRGDRPPIPGSYAVRSLPYRWDLNVVR
ncbi:MAG: DUF547 domain-containing protein [Nitrospinae bacterium]|nr:DUF547 domain-containing protein [Nitrospinota bacterium]